MSARTDRRDLIDLPVAIAAPRMLVMVRPRLVLPALAGAVFFVRRESRTNAILPPYRTEVQIKCKFVAIF